MSGSRGAPRAALQRPLPACPGATRRGSGHADGKAGDFLAQLDWGEDFDLGAEFQEFARRLVEGFDRDVDQGPAGVVALVGDAHLADSRAQPGEAAQGGGGNPKAHLVAMDPRLEFPGPGGPPSCEIEAGRAREGLPGEVQGVNG